MADFKHPAFDIQIHRREILYADLLQVDEQVIQGELLAAAPMAVLATIAI